MTHWLCAAEADLLAGGEHVVEDRWVGARMAHDLTDVGLPHPPERSPARGAT